MQINTISHLHRLLSSDEAQRPVDLGHHLGMIASALGSGLIGDVVIVESIDSDCTVAPHRLLPTAQIVTEAISNAIKHGRHPGWPGRIEVVCGKDADGTVLVEIRDNGPGLPVNGCGKSDAGNGSRLVRALAGQINATVEYRSTNQGLKVRLSLPREETRDDTIIPAHVLARVRKDEICLDLLNQWFTG